MMEEQTKSQLITMIYENGSNTQASGVLTKDDIDALLENMFDHERSDPNLIYVSLPDAWRIRRAWIYRAYRLPRRTLRACFLRRRQTRINQGKRRLAQRQRNEQRKLVKP